ncbi:MAG: carbohydrate-binding domain-containing protein [Oscillospiraceae bacterium]|nr:carbohydrate-binding domain-containing protein [Oscillospiraceae bacterium]
MKFRTMLTMLLAAAMLFALAACAKNGTPAASDAPTAATEAVEGDIVELTLTEGGVVCESDAVYAANDVIYYEAGHDETYGAGTAADAHTAEEAAEHTVVHITAPGTYHVTGKLKGQLFVDLGEDAKKDENARVTLLLDGAEINCTVAPAVLFYRVYECADKETFTLTPDLSNAGAVVVLQGENNVAGSHVAKIYKEGTTDKLYKFDGAFYSKTSLRIEGDGVLNVTADNEGLDTELHLQIDGGEINIYSQDDGVNTNEDGVSVTTINGGRINISGGNGSEGDGIDSNGAIVVNGGSLYASANPQTGDGGIDADLGIYLNGGTVIATGSRNDEISSESKQVLMDLTFAGTVKKGAALALFDGDVQVFGFTATREFSALVISVPALRRDVPYTLTVDDAIQQHGGKGAPLGPVQPANPGAPGSGTLPDPTDGQPPQAPQNGGPGSQPPAPPSDGNELPIVGVELPPEPFTPSDLTPPSGDRPEPPSGDVPGMPAGTEEVSATFTVTADNHTFRNVTAANDG